MKINEEISNRMKKVRSKGNSSTEIAFMNILKKNKIHGWRRSYTIYGKPDFVFAKNKIAIFIDGCFWHGHNCRNLRPQKNKEYWKNKIKKNKERDFMVTKALQRKKWHVVRIWECDLKKELVVNKILKKIWRYHVKNSTV